MKYTFSFKEINYGSITIDSDHEPDSGDVIDSIMNGNAYFNDTEYEDIRLDEIQKDKPKPERSYER